MIQNLYSLYFICATVTSYDPESGTLNIAFVRQRVHIIQNVIFSVFDLYDIEFI